jgi:cell shape-determining protein MreC
MNPEKEKPKFEDYVKKYIDVDNEIETLQEKLKTMKEWKRKLTSVIVKLMQEQDLTENTLEVYDGTLRYH